MVPSPWPEPQQSLRYTKPPEPLAENETWTQVFREGARVLTCLRGMLGGLWLTTPPAELGPLEANDERGSQSWEREKKKV